MRLRPIVLGLIFLACVVSSLRAADQKPTTAPAPRVLVILAEGFNREEYWKPYKALTGAGYQIDVASIARGKVECRPGKPSEFDVDAQYSLDDVNVRDYVGLMIPGGYSPGLLEKYPKALEICRQFSEAGKPIGAVCHGPRLLMRAGLLKDRVATCLFSVKDELADDWVAGKQGKFVDQAVVVDGDLITSRYPGDLADFSVVLLRHFADAGGLPTTQPVARDARPYGAAVTLEAGFDDRALAAMQSYLQEPGKRVALIAPKAGWMRGKAGVPFPVIASGDLPVDAKPAATLTLGPAGVRDVHGAEAKDIREFIAQAQRDSDDASEFTAAIALREGFDDRVVSAMLAHLRRMGRSVVLVGPKKSELRGLNGVTVRVAATFDAPPALAEDAIIVAPGGLWPEQTDARQAQQPQWIAQQAAADQARLNWLLTRRDAGATLLVFGQDSLSLGRNAALKGKDIAAPEATVWSFGKSGGQYRPQEALQSDDRLITGKGFNSIPEALNLLK